MKKYVLGICLSEDKKHICVIKKNRGPGTMAGNYNAPGGKIEKDEPAIDAMVREFEEETGVHIPATDWELFCYKSDDKTFVVSIYHASTDKVFDCKTVEDEEISVIPVADLAELSLYDNLDVIISRIIDYTSPK